MGPILEKLAQFKGRKNFKGKNIKNKPFHVKRLKKLI